MAHTILRLSAVIARTALSRSTIYRLMPLGKFPKALRITEGAVGWLEADIDAWIAARIPPTDSAVAGPAASAQ